MFLGLGRPHRRRRGIRQQSTSSRGCVVQSLVPKAAGEKLLLLSSSILSFQQLSLCATFNGNIGLSMGGISFRLTVSIGMTGNILIYGTIYYRQQTTLLKPAQRGGLWG